MHSLQWVFLISKIFGILPYRIKNRFCVYHIHFVIEFIIISFWTLTTCLNRNYFQYGLDDVYATSTILQFGQIVDVVIFAINGTLYYLIMFCQRNRVLELRKQVSELDQVELKGTKCTVKLWNMCLILGLISRFCIMMALFIWYHTCVIRQMDFSNAVYNGLIGELIDMFPLLILTQYTFGLLFLYRKYKMMNGILKKIHIERDAFDSGKWSMQASGKL